MKYNILIGLICQHFSNLVACDENYDDICSLNEALRIAQSREDFEQCDIQGWHNPHLDWIFEEWNSLTK